MKTPSFLCLAAVLLSAVSAFIFSSCSQHKEQVSPLETLKVSPLQTSKEDFTGTFLQSLQILDVSPNGVLVISKKKNGYSFLVSRPDSKANGGRLAPDDSTPQLVCQGSGISFARCCQGYLDAGKTLTVTKCNPTSTNYCAFL